MISDTYNQLSTCHIPGCGCSKAYASWTTEAPPEISTGYHWSWGQVLFSHDLSKSSPPTSICSWRHSGLSTFVLFVTSEYLQLLGPNFALACMPVNGLYPFVFLGILRESVLLVVVVKSSVAPCSRPMKSDQRSKKGQKLWWVDAKVRHHVYVTPLKSSNVILLILVFELFASYWALPTHGKRVNDSSQCWKHKLAVTVIEPWSQGFPGETSQTS